MTTLNIFAVAALVFVHLKDPDTKKPVYLQKEVKRGEGKDAVTELVDDLTKPVGVRMYTPGSTHYRKVQAGIVTSTLKTGIKNMTGDSSESNAIDLLAQTTYEFVNLTGEGVKKPTYEDAMEIYSNPEYIAIREQVADEQTDLGNASRARSKA